MSEKQSCSPSLMLSPHTSDVRLYERVRLQSFQSLLSASPAGRFRSPTRHPRVILEDLLKAEVLSTQLVLAIEDLVKSLLSMMDSCKENGEDYGMSSTTEDESIRSFRSALVQSANTLDELTKLQISENGRDVNDPQTTENGGLFVNTASVVEHHETNDGNHTINQPRFGKILSSGSDSTTPKSSSLSARESEFSSTSPSDVTIACDEHDVSGRDENGNHVAFLHEAVKTLRNEVQELQAKHEMQFITFASKFIELDEDERPSTRNILEKIMQKLSPQDQNWTFHGRLDEAEMEHLFYFVLLQKTLKSCLAVMNTPEAREFNRKPENIRVRENRPNRRDLIPSSSNANGPVCVNCRRSLRDRDSADETDPENVKEKYQTYGESKTLLNVPKSEIQYNSSDSNEEPVLNGLTKSSLKRPHDFEFEQQSKKRKKGKNLFSCFSTKWLRNNRRSKKL
ncbi:uncharacterized protein LOC114516355 [Dendronephthya gigantea]|uniref:uncharacterized protein LOC114516355 n=1 Tax=Dendronephthya gigantea TaxID=151771 RepID=UPI00106D6ADB|nr:uncharacterized protein LOC114516355 [Dendronephthya gigantea]